MYIVAFDHPFYPEVDYFDTLEEAQARFDEVLKESATDDGAHASKVTLAAVSRTVEIRTDY